VYNGIASLLFLGNRYICLHRFIHYIEIHIIFIFTRHDPCLLERRSGRTRPDVAGSSQELLPALLLIHGDSYSWGAGNSFDGTALAAHGRLIVVSINFRLGVLGKLAISSDPPRVCSRSGALYSKGSPPFRGIRAAALLVDRDARKESFPGEEWWNASDSLADKAAGN